MQFNWFLPVANTRTPIGRVRKRLRRIGDSWMQSPFRRVVQAVCFIAFVVLFFYVCWPYTDSAAPSAAAGGNWPTHYADHFAAREPGEAELFLAIDPLVSIATAIAARSWVWSLTFAGVILAVCLFIPRGFCGYICPLGTLIDLFDWAVGKRVTRFRTERQGWWVNLKYYILTACLASAMFGVMIIGFVAAIPVVTRGFQFIFAPLQMGFMRGWHQVPPMNAGHFVSIALFLGVLMLGLLQPRFGCRYVCPTGAVFSLGNLFRFSQRAVTSDCINCGKCVQVCPFNAINADFSTRTSDCTLCQTCGGACPTQAIHFVTRPDRIGDRSPGDDRMDVGRRRFLKLGVGAAAGVVGGAGSALAIGISNKAHNHPPVVRPPGSVPEKEFLDLCVRCGECFKACPNNVLQPLGFDRGWDGLWTPAVLADWSGCEPSCNNCGQVCPTGAIRALPMDEKRVARMGLAVINTQTCLPHAGTEACQLCVDECQAAGYHAIEFIRVHVEVDDEGLPIEGSGYSAPVMRADLCVGCGLCQTRCNKINVYERRVLRESAIIVEAGEGKEDRLMRGSYIELRQAERKAKQQAAPTPADDAPGGSYLPDFLQ